jgi:hypothetical protein
MQRGLSAEGEGAAERGCGRDHEFRWAHDLSFRAMGADILSCLPRLKEAKEAHCPNFSAECRCDFEIAEVGLSWDDAGP